MSEAKTLSVMEQRALEKKKRVGAMKSLISNEEIQERFSRILGENKNTFLASVLDLYTSDAYLAECDPNLVMMEAIKAATLKLPMTKALGYAYIVPFKNKSGVPIPTFVPGYRGLIQLALRTGEYKYINADCVYEGQSVKTNVMTGMTEISGEKTSDKVIGYFAYIELVHGFCKMMYWTKACMEEFAKTKSRAWNIQSSPWHTDFDAMAKKTMLKQVLKFGPMSVEMMGAIADEKDEVIEAEAAANANQEPLVFDMESGEVEQPAENDNVVAPAQEQADEPEEPDF